MYSVCTFNHISRGTILVAWVVKTYKKHVAQILKIYTPLQTNLFSFASVADNSANKQYVPNTYTIQKLRWPVK